MLVPVVLIALLRGVAGTLAALTLAALWGTAALPRPAAAATLDFPKPTASPTLPASTLNFCNKYAETVYVAFAFQQNGDWTSAGWLKVASNTCRAARVVANYYRAETESRSLGGGASEQHTWGTTRRFCVGDAKFMFHHADAPCSGARFKEYSGRPDAVFREITLESDGLTVTSRKATIRSAGS